MALAFLLLDLPVLLWLGTTDAAWDTHALLTVVLALMLGSLSASGSMEEANLEFLLARRMPRTAIWMLSTLAGGALVFAFGLLAPRLAALFAPELFASTGSRSDLAALQLPIGTMLFFVASAVAGVTRRPFVAIPVAVSLALVIFVAVAVMAAFSFPSRYGTNWRLWWEWERTLRTNAFTGTAILAAVISWLSLVRYRDPFQRGRRLATYGTILAAVGVVLGVIAFDSATLSPREAVRELEDGWYNRQTGDAVLVVAENSFARGPLVDALSRELSAADPDSSYALSLAIALARQADEGGLWLCVERLHWLALSDDWPPRLQDRELLKCLSIAGMQDLTREALFLLAARTLHAQVPNGAPPWKPEMAWILKEIVWATGIEDPARAAQMWMPVFERLAADGKWSDLESLVLGPWNGLRLQAGDELSPFVDYRPLLSEPVLAAARKVAVSNLSVPAFEFSPQLAAVGQILAGTCNPADQRLGLLVAQYSIVPGRGCDATPLIDTAGEMLKRWVLEESLRPFLCSWFTIPERSQYYDLKVAMQLLIRADHEGRIDPEVVVYAQYLIPEHKRRSFNFGLVALLRYGTPASLRLAREQAEAQPDIRWQRMAAAREGDADARRVLAAEARAALSVPGLRAQEEAQRSSYFNVLECKLWEVDPELARLLADAAHAGEHDLSRPALELAAAGRPEGIPLLVDALEARSAGSSYMWGYSARQILARALEHYTGQNFGGDTKAWRRWLRNR